MNNQIMPLTDRNVSRLKSPAKGRYKVRDAELKGFFLTVGQRRRTYMVRGDLRQNGRRVSSVTVSVGDARSTSAREARSLAKSYLGKIGRGEHPIEEKQLVLCGDPAAAKTVTLREAWNRYLEVHLLRKNRAESTIDSYRDHCERLFKSWLDEPLKKLADDPARVARMHDRITKKNGPYIANSSMRTLRAIYRHARKTNRKLPAYNPADAVDWNVEKRRNTGMGLGDLPAWFEQLASLTNPIRREYHLFTLLSGCRPRALIAARLGDLDLRRRTLHIPSPKGGEDRAFDIPLSREMIRCVIRAIRAGRIMYPDNDEWLFPADSETGHIIEHKEKRSRLSKWGNDLRQSFRNFAAIAGLSEVDAKLLMNHALPGVNSGYITRHKLLEDHLRSQQQAISDVIFDDAAYPLRPTTSLVTS